MFDHVPTVGPARGALSRAVFSPCFNIPHTYQLLLLLLIYYYTTTTASAYVSRGLAPSCRCMRLIRLHRTKSSRLLRRPLLPGPGQRGRGSHCRTGRVRATRRGGWGEGSGRRYTDGFFWPRTLTVEEKGEGSWLARVAPGGRRGPWLLLLTFRSDSAPERDQTRNVDDDRLVGRGSLLPGMLHAHR